MTPRERFLLFLALGMLALAVAVAQATFAAPPAGVTVDPALHEWFEKQYNQVGGWCCNLSDGHILDDEDWRTSNGAYEVRIEDVWYPIAPDKLRRGDGGPNPTGHAIVWYTTGTGQIVIYCFCPGFEG